MQPTPTITTSEFNRLIELAELDLDYSNLKESFKYLTRLASRIAGTEISLINLIDSYTQWTIAEHGLPIEQLSREDTICQYTIMESNQFEVKDLSVDKRFKDKDYVKAGPELRYYFGIPLRTKKGHNIGSLCVMDKNIKTLDSETTEMLKIIANEIVDRLIALQTIQSLSYTLAEAREIKKRVAHDIRGPIGGIIGLAGIIKDNGYKNKMDEVLEYVTLIQESGNSLLDLTDEILRADVKTPEQKPELGEHELNLLVFKDKLEKLFIPQAKNKNVNFIVSHGSDNTQVPFPKNKLLQISSNLISNAIKFTPANGKVHVYLNLIVDETAKTLQIQVQDSGIGLTDQNIKDILNCTAKTTTGTKGEQGYGFGLPLVKFLIDSLNGAMTVQSKPDEGTTFTITIPII